MSAKFKKIDKWYVLSDSTVNVYGFRLLTSGYQREMYERNPIGFDMHNRDGGVVVRWEDITIEGDEIKAKPKINLAHPNGQRLVDEVENGFKNGASVGRIIVLEYSDDPSLKLPGQTGPTVTKWYHKECSLCDIPGNDNSLALFDKDGAPINLADFTKENNLAMKQVILTAASLALLKLKDDSETAVVDQAIKDLKDKADQFEALKVEKSNLETKVTELEKTAKDQKVANLVDNAVKEGKILPVQADQYKKLALADFDSVEALLSAAPAHKTIQSQLADQNKTENAAAIAELMKIPASELFESDRMEELKGLSMPHFKIKYKEFTGKDFVE